MPGKQKCRILREIRRRIAEENDIPFVTRECTHRGECRGTCPRCESELRYLEEQLCRRQALGKRVAVAALCAGMALTAAGCAAVPEKETPTDDLMGMIDVAPMPTETPEVYVTSGEVVWEPETTEEPESGEVPVELMGDVAWEQP